MIKRFKLFAITAAIIVAVTACKSTKTQETLYETEKASEVIAESVSEPAPSASPTASEPSPTYVPTATPALTPTPAAVPEPTAENVVTQTVKEDEQKHLCTLSVQCSTVLNNMDKLSPSAVVPPDGIILPKKQVEVIEGESVFDLLLRTMRQEGIHLEFSGTPVYNSSYIEGINNLYEFDCGELSGWMYKVNGVFPKKGCSEVYLKSGDVVEWVYTCNLGKDVGDTMN